MSSELVMTFDTCPHPEQPGHGTGCTCGGRSKSPFVFERAPVMSRSCMTRVLTIGTFDLLHYGQVDMLRAAARLGTELTVGVNTDAFAASYKRRPVMTQDERIYAIRQLGYPALFNDSAGIELISEVGPDVLAIGSDWARRDYLAQIGVTWEWLEERKITLAYVPYVHQWPISTSEIIRRITGAPGGPTGGKPMKPIIGDPGAPGLRKPRVCDLVHYVSHGTPPRPDGSQAFTSECRAAIVTEVDPEDPGVVGLCVLNPTGQFFNRGVTQDEGDEAARGRWGGTWHWPERA